MTNREVALEYLKRFCAGDVDGLAPLLAPGLTFRGPYGSYDSAADYLDALKNDPPEPSDFRLLSVTEGEDAVAVFYEYRKGGRGMPIAQWFRIFDRKISEMLVVFGGRSPA